MNEKVRRRPLQDAFISGLVSGTFSTTLLQPFDVIKTRLQSCYLSSNNRSKQRVSIYGLTKKIILEENITTLWRGLTPSLLRTVPGMGLYFSSIHFLTSDYPPSSFRSASAGFISRAFVAFALSPITVVKTRFESKSFSYNSVIQALTTIYKTEGISGLWKGTWATIAKDAPYSGLYLLFYTEAKTFKPLDLKETDNLYVIFQLFCGGTAGVAATVVTQPADTIKTKIQVSTDESKPFHVVKNIYKNYGMSGFFQGFVPRMLRRTIMSALSWTLFEQSTRILSKENS